MDRAFEWAKRVLDPQRFIAAKILVAVFLLGLLVVWDPYVRPEITEYGDDFSYSAEVVSYDNLYSPDAASYDGEVRSDTTFSYQARKIDDQVLGVTNLFDVRTPEGDPIFSAERLYGIHHETTEHTLGYGDRDRVGYLFGPPEADKEPFIYWHVNYDQPLTMRFEDEENLFGLTTYRYGSTFTADQTESLGDLPDVGETRGIELDVTLDIWIEPETGYLVSYEDSATAYYYELSSGERIYPWNQFRNSYSFDSTARHAEIASQLRNKAIAVKDFGTPALALALNLLVPVILVGIAKKRESKLDSAVLGGSVFVMLLALIAILVWLFGNPALLRPFGTSAGIHWSTALIFLFFNSLLLWLAARRRMLVRRIVVVNVLLAIVIVVSVLNISGNIFDFGVVIQGGGFAMAPATSLGFIFISLTVINIIWGVRSKFARRMSWTFCSIIGTIGVASAVATIYQVQPLVDNEWLRAVSIPTAGAFFVTSLVLYRVDGIFSQYKIHVPLELSRALIAGSATAVVSIMLTGIVWVAFRDSTARNAELQFEGDTSRISSLIVQQVDSYISSLYGARSLFEASDEVTREEWRAYVDGVGLKTNFPGSQGIGFAEVVPAEELASFEQEVRSEGFVDFSVHPIYPQRDTYTSVVYLEPFDSRNQRAFGYDMFSQETRRIAMSRARDTGNASLSGKVRLLQETDTDVQSGFLVYTPLYAKNKPVSTTEERQAALLGYVYSPVRMNNFIRAAVGDQSGGILTELFDARHSEDLNGDTLLYSPSAEDQPSDPRFEKIEQLEIAGHVWSVRYRSVPAYNPVIAENYSRLVLVGGVGISVLLGLVVLLLVGSRQRALKLAAGMTESLSVERNNAIRLRRRDEAILGSLGEGLVMFGIDGRIERMNPVAVKLIGYDEGECLGRKFYDVFIATDMDGRIIKQQDRPAHYSLTSAQKTSKKLHYRRKDGTYFPARVTVSPIVMDGEVVGSVEVFRDITQEQQLEQAKNDFIALASHQLRTPATAVKGYISLVLEGFMTTKKEIKESLEQAFASNERQISIISDLLNVAKIESGRLKPMFAEFDLVELAKQSVEEQRFSIDLRKQKIKLEAPKELMVVSDHSLVGFCLTNLISNASKYTADRGSVLVVLKEKNGRVSIEVTDSGVGIAKKDQGKLFKRFSRIQNERSTKVSGTGLGLYIIKEALDLLKGKISVKSALGKGAAFTITLPKGGPRGKSTRSRG